MLPAERMVYALVQRQRGGNHVGGHEGSGEEYPLALLFGNRYLPSTHHRQCSLHEAGGK